MAALDGFSTYQDNLSSPASHAATVVPNDSTDMVTASRFLWVGTSGDVKVTTIAGNTVVFGTVQGILPVRVARVWAAGTTATNIVAIW